MSVSRIAESGLPPRWRLQRLTGRTPGHAEYAAMGDRLRKPGFDEDSSEGAPICRWVSGHLRLDMMPLSKDILGFSNRWHRAAIDNSVDADIGGGLILRAVSAPLFLATKLEAFRTRGRSEFALSHDLEDIIAVVDG